jgi:hypothetical protein
MEFIRMEGLISVKSDWEGGLLRKECLFIFFERKEDSAHLQMSNEDLRKKKQYWDKMYKVGVYQQPFF